MEDYVTSPFPEDKYFLHKPGSQEAETKKSVTQVSEG